jgi:hypothetical protein
MAPKFFGKTMPPSGMLPEDGIVLPKHVGAIVKENEEVYNFSDFSWLISKE